VNSSTAKPAPVVLLWYESGFEAQAGLIIVSGYISVCFEIKFSQARTEGSVVSSLICDRWLILGLETLSISRCLNR